MNATNLTHDEVHDSMDATRKTAAGSLFVEAVGGIAAIVLTIVGLGGWMRPEMAAISAILIGASLLFEGGAFAASYRRQLFDLKENRVAGSDFSGALTIEFLAGVSGIVLGILALLGIAATTLVSVAAVVFGSAFLLGTSAAWQSGIIQSGRRTIPRNGDKFGGRRGGRPSIDWPHGHCAWHSGPLEHEPARAQPGRASGVGRVGPFERHVGRQENNAPAGLVRNVSGKRGTLAASLRKTAEPLFLRLRDRQGLFAPAQF